MDNQQMFNVGILIIGALMGWLMRIIWSELKALQGNDKTLADKVNGIEVLVAGQYVKKDDMEKITTALFTKLDRIEDKIDKKADK